MKNINLATTKASSTKKPFAVFDIDGTLIRWQLYHAIVDQLASDGFLDAETYDNVQNARRLWKERSHNESFHDYELSLIEAYNHLLKQLMVSEFNKAMEAVFDKYKDQVYMYTRNLITKLKAKGYILLIISGSQQEIVSKIADYYGFDDCVGTTYEHKAGRFTGKNDAIFTTKHIILQELIKKHNLQFKDSMAVGDSEGGIKMLGMVERPIVFNPSKKLLTVAQANNWTVIIERKNVVYELRPHNGSYILASTNN